MTDISNKIHDEIYKYELRRLKPKSIVVHPHAIRDMIDSLQRHSDSFQSEFLFAGIRVIRSFDVKEDEVFVIPEILL